MACVSSLSLADCLKRIARRMQASSPRPSPTLLLPPSLLIPHTDMTSEHRACLYTKRLTQRQKKWQDGSMILDRTTGKVHIKAEKGVSENVVRVLGRV